MTLSEFWAATITETLMVIRASHWRMDEQQRLLMWHAWHTAALAGANFGKNGIPSLKGLMPKKRTAPPRPMTVEEEAAIWRAWAQEHNAAWKAAS